MTEKPFRFAIMGAGNIAGSFCSTVGKLENVTVCAIASKDPARAETFAQNNKVPAFYGNYEEMLECERPDCVYIATTPDSHFRLTMLCLNKGFPVLCEKAMFVNSAEAEEAFRCSEVRGVFSMEALWSRFLPANEQAKQWLQEGRIGDLTFCDASIGFCPNKDPQARYFSPALCGGAATDITVYAYELTRFFLEKPPLSADIRVLPAETGVDAAETVLLTFPHAHAVIATSFVSSYNDHLILYGTKGRIEIPHPHYASAAILYEDGKEPVRFEPEHLGFAYEILECVSCVRGGRIESERVPHALTLECARLFDRIHEQCPAYQPFFGTESSL